MTRFLDKEMAKAEISVKLKRQKDYFCPVINARCREDCICLYMGQVQEGVDAHGGKTYVTCEPGCRHPAIAGIIQVEQ